MSYFLESFLRPPLPPPSLQWSSNSAVMTFFALPGTSRTRCVYFVDGYSLPSVISAAADPLLIPDEILLLVYVVAAHDPLVAADSAVESRESVGERGGATPMPPRLHLLNPKSKDELTQLASVHIQSLDLLAPPNVAFVSVGAWAGFDFSTLVRSKRKSMDLQSPATPNPFHSIILHLASTFLGDEERSSLDSMLQKFLERESTTSLPHTPVDLYERIRTAMKDFADESLLISMLINLLIISRVFWVTGKGMYGISEAKALRCVVNVEVVRSLSGRLLHRKFESGGSPSPTMPEIEPSTRAPDEMTKKVEMQPHPVPSNREYSHRQSRTPVEVQRPSPPPQGEPPTSPTLDSRRLTRTPVEIQRPSPPPQGEPPTSPTLDSRRLTRTPVEIQRPSPPPQGEPPTSPTLDSRRLTSQENERRKSRGIYRVESNEDTSGNKRMGEVGNGESRKKVRISDLSVDERNESDQNGGARETMSPLTPKTPKIAYLHQHGVTRGNLVGSQTPENIEARRSTTQNIPPSAMNAPPMQPTSATLPVFVPPPRPSFAPPAFNPSIGFPAPLTLPLTTSTNTLNNFTPSIANTPTTFVAPQAFSTPTITGPHPATSTHVDRLDDFLRRHYPNRDPAEYTTTCLDPAVCALENVVTTVPLYRGRVRAVDQVLESAALFQTPDAAIQDAARLGCNFFRAFYDAARETEKFRPGAQALSQLFVDADDANEDEDEGEDGEIVEGGAGDAGGDENADRGVENLGSGKGAPKKWLPMLTLWAQKRVCTLTFDFLDKEEHAGFVAVVEVEGQKFRSRRAHRKKMDAKEDAAELACEALEIEYTIKPPTPASDPSTPNKKNAMMLLNEYCQKYKLTKTIVTERPGPGVYVIALQVGEQVYRSTPQVRKQDAKVEAAKVAMEALVPGSLDKDDGEEKDAKKGSGSQSGGFSGAGRGQLVRPHYGYQQQQQQQQQQPQYFGPQGFGGFPFGGMGMMSGYMGGHQQNVFGTMAGQGFAFGAGTAAGTGPATPQVPIRFPFRGQFPAAGRPSGPPF